MIEDYMVPLYRVQMIFYLYWMVLCIFILSFGAKWEQ